MPAVKNEDRCWFTYADGRRCRSPKVSADARLCFDHWQREEQLDDARKSGDWIVAPTNRLETAEEIHEALGNLFRLAAHGRLAARQATALAYIGHLMLCALPHIRKEQTERDAGTREITAHLLHGNFFNSPAEKEAFLESVGLSHDDILETSRQILLGAKPRKQPEAADLPPYGPTQEPPVTAEN